RGRRQARRAHPRGAREGSRRQSRRRGGAAAGAVAGGGIARRSQSDSRQRGHLRVAPFHCLSPGRARKAVSPSYLCGGERFILRTPKPPRREISTLFSIGCFLPSTNLSALCRALISRRRPRRQTATGD